MGEVRLVTLTDEAIRPHLRDLARLRAAVFRDWPYLYDADPAQEADYQGAYARSRDMVLVLAMDGDRAVGAATCLPLRDETANVRRPFEAAGADPSRFFYLGESVLLPGYRGTGLGVRFFEAREDAARRHPAIAFATFCAVERPHDHPMRPAGATDLHAFWRKRGYLPIPLQARMSWRDLGDAGETEKVMRFWAKPLRDDPLPFPAA